MLRRSLACLLFLASAAAPAQETTSPVPAATPSDPAAPEAPGTPDDPGAPTAPPLAAAAKEDPYLVDWRKWEHRDERAAGRGPMGRKIGFGLALGRPLSINTRIFFTQTIAFQADLGVTYSWAAPAIDLSGHLVWHPSTLRATDQYKVGWYVGGGVRGSWWPLLMVGIPPYVPSCAKPVPADVLLAAAQGNTSDLQKVSGCRRPVFMYAPGGDTVPGTIGGQGLIGVDMQFQRMPMELYAQALGTVEVFPGISLDAGAQLGARWYFW